MNKQDTITPIYSNLTGKQIAKLAINYSLKEMDEEANYQKQINELVKTLTNSTGPEYNFYWNLFKNVQLIMSDCEATYLWLALSYSHLSKNNLYTLLFPLISSDKVKSFDLNFRHMEESMPNSVQTIEFNLNTLNSFFKIVTDIEKNYFDSEPIVLRKFVFDKAFALKEDFKKHNEHIREVFFGKNEFHQPIRDASKGNKESWIIKRFDEIDDVWVKEQYDLIVSTSKKDSGYKWLESNFFGNLLNKKGQKFDKL